LKLKKNYSNSTARQKQGRQFVGLICVVDCWQKSVSEFSRRNGWVSKHRIL